MLIILLAKRNKHNGVRNTVAKHLLQLSSATGISYFVVNSVAEPWRKSMRHRNIIYVTSVFINSQRPCFVKPWEQLTWPQSTNFVILSFLISLQICVICLYVISEMFARLYLRLIIFDKIVFQSYMKYIFSCSSWFQINFVLQFSSEI